MQTPAHEHTGTPTRGRQLTAYITGAARRTLPPEILDAAKKALLDYLAVAIGATDERVVQVVRTAALQWNATGRARIFFGPETTPALAALVNGTAAHAADYDDTHPQGAGHPSAPCWSTALALAGHHGLDETRALAGFVTGYEVMSKLGNGGPPGGLVASFGTHGKPFHAGKAAMDGILAAQLADAGFVAATHCYELEKGLLDAFIQNREVEVPVLDFDTKWEILENGFKPFACCRATQASTQAARSLAARVGMKKVVKVHAKVHPNALVTAGKRNPRTALEGKFSVPFCISLGLRGYRAVSSDFVETTMRDPAVMQIVPVVELEAVQGQAPHSAHLDVYLEDGERLHADTEVVMGHPLNPMGWDDLRVKFEGLVEPMLGTSGTRRLYEIVHDFERPGSLASVLDLLATRRHTA